MSIKDQEINDIIKLSTSPYNAPLLVVPKKGTNGTKQHLLVVDFRKLNTKIVKFSSKNETIPKYPKMQTKYADSSHFAIIMNVSFQTLLKGQNLTTLFLRGTRYLNGMPNVKNPWKLCVTN